MYATTMRPLISTGHPFPFPIIVRTEADAAEAVQKPKTVSTDSDRIDLDVKSLTIRATHTLSPTENPDCRALAGNAEVSVAQLEEKCEVTCNKVTRVQYSSDDRFRGAIRSTDGVALLSARSGFPPILRTITV
jgi:hypothetical protein